MNYLLDTCVLSEFTRRKPGEKVIRWVDRIDEEKIFISVITLGEIQRGAERLPESARKPPHLGQLDGGMRGRRTGKRKHVCGGSSPQRPRVIVHQPCVAKSEWIGGVGDHIGRRDRPRPPIPAPHRPECAAAYTLDLHVRVRE